METFLPSTINHALAAATDFLEQLVIAKFCPAKCFAGVLQLDIVLWQGTEDRLQQAGSAELFPGEKFRATFPTGFCNSRAVSGSAFHTSKRY